MSQKWMLKILGVALVLGGCTTLPTKNPWAEVRSPSIEEVQSVGGTSAGCLEGGRALGESGDGYFVMRPSRNRFYGNESLIRFVRELAKKFAASQKRMILVGDLSQPRGGPTLSGHASHQTGLDVDIWYETPLLNEPFSNEKREDHQSRSILLSNGPEIDQALWNESQVELLKDSANAPETERIFVNPSIKKRLCRQDSNAKWLSKLRPWWGHDDHFHVRLGCPKDSQACIPQAPPDPGNGCDATLEWWFSDEARSQAREMDEHPKPPVMPVLPERCAALLEKP